LNSSTRFDFFLQRGLRILATSPPCPSSAALFPLSHPHPPAALLGALRVMEEEAGRCQAPARHGAAFAGSEPHRRADAVSIPPFPLSLMPLHPATCSQLPSEVSSLCSPSATVHSITYPPSVQNATSCLVSRVHNTARFSPLLSSPLSLLHSSSTLFN
jgi:hypothetical protein